MVVGVGLGFGPVLYAGGIYIKKNSNKNIGGAIEDFAEAHVCKRCVILRPRLLRVSYVLRKDVYVSLVEGIVVVFSVKVCCLNAARTSSKYEYV